MGRFLVVPWKVTLVTEDAPPAAVPMLLVVTGIETACPATPLVDAGSETV